MMPATMPIKTAELAFTKAQGAVMATSPANIPLQAIEISGFPNFRYQNSQRGGRAGARRQVGVYGDHADAQVR